MAQNDLQYGFITALYIRAKHLMNSESDEARKMAQNDIQYASVCLGKELSVDFMDSSPWPTTPLELYLNLNESEFLRFSTYEERVPVPPPIVDLPVQWPQSSRQARVERPLTLTVLGTHATLSLEPVDMLSRLLEKAPLTSGFYGLERRWCAILGICIEGATSEAFTALFRRVEQEPYGHPWDQVLGEVRTLYDQDPHLQAADLMVCTEPFAGCLMLQAIAAERSRRLPLLAFLGVAILNNCPPLDIPRFWEAFRSQVLESDNTVVAVNNPILAEQLYYQAGFRPPTVRAMGLYTNVTHVPLRTDALIWRSILFMFQAFRCAVGHFVDKFEAPGGYPINLVWMGDEAITYKDIASFRATVLLPWDHALMTYYELYSMEMPLLLPAKEWMLRFVYMRGQLSVGEPMYQSIAPWHAPYRVEREDPPLEIFEKRTDQNGLGSAKAARGVAEDMLTKALDAEDLNSAKMYARLGMELIMDMKYFLAVASNETSSKDSYSSAGKVMRAAVPTAE